MVLVPAHPGNPGQSPESRKTDVCMSMYDSVTIRALGPQISAAEEKHSSRLENLIRCINMHIHAGITLHNCVTLTLESVHKEQLFLVLTAQAQAVFTMRCTVVQSAVLLSHVVRPSVCDVGGS